MNCMFCSICREEFNQEQKKPITLSCGHTFCQQCLQGISNLNNNFIKKCSLCNQNINTTYLSLSINIVLMQIIDKKKVLDGKFYCNKHQKEIQYMCVKFNTYLCQVCMESQQDYNSIKNITSADFFDELKNLELILKNQIEKIGFLQKILDEITNIQTQNKITDKNFYKFKKFLNDNYQKYLNSDIKRLQELSFFNPNQQLQDINSQSEFLQQENIESLKQWLNKDDLNLKLIYKATRDGFEADNFHEKCDNQGKTILIIRSENNQIFGGYADPQWNNKGSCISGDGKSFLFSFTKKVQLLCIDKNKELNGNSYGFGAVFGFGKDTSDLAIFNESNTSIRSHSNLGNSYQLPKDIAKNTVDAKKFLAGSKRFKTLEIEVHKILD